MTTLYNPEAHDPLIKEAILYGFSQEETAKFLGIGVSTWKDWRKNNSTIQAVLKKAEEERIDELRKWGRIGLYKLIKGGETEEITTDTRTVILKDKKGKELNRKQTVVSEKKTTKRVAPHAGAIFFALSNIDAATFPNKQRLEADIKDERIPGGSKDVNAKEEHHLEQLKKEANERRNKGNQADSNQ